MKKTLKKFLILLFLVILQSCTTTYSNYECPIRKFPDVVVLADVFYDYYDLKRDYKICTGEIK